MKDYHFEFVHPPRSKHNNADALSRRPCRQCEVAEETVEVCPVTTILGRTDPLIPETSFQASQLKASYVTDPQLATFYELFTTTTERVPWEMVVGQDRITKTLWNQWDRIAAMEGVLYREWESKD